MTNIAKDEPMKLSSTIKNLSFLKNGNNLVALALALSAAFGARSMAAAPEPTKGEVETRKIMAGLFSSLTTVLPLSLNSAEFSDPKNRDKILSELDKMRESANSFVNHTKRFDGSYGYIAKSMATDLRDIYGWYKKGSTSESRYLLQQVTDNCVSCHLKLPDPGHAPRMDAFFKDASIAKLSGPDKVRLQVALRQFDDALVTWEDLFKTWPNPAELFAMDTLPEYLKVLIRVKGDTNRAGKTLEAISQRVDLPKYMNREVTAWKASLVQLSAVMGKTGTELARAEKIVKNARDRMEYPMDRAGLVDFIVASGLLNRYLLDKKLKADDISASYYLLGITETLIGRSTWLSQTDYYFEAAIRAAPKSKSGKKAYDALEQQVIMQNSGSAGMNIPDDVQENLEELRKMVYH